MEGRGGLLLFWAFNTDFDILINLCFFFKILANIPNKKLTPPHTAHADQLRCQEGCYNHFQVSTNRILYEGKFCRYIERNRVRYRIGFVDRHIMLLKFWLVVEDKAWNGF